MMTLISMIIIFSGQGLQLKNPEVVQGIQKKYSHMLYRSESNENKPDKSEKQHTLGTD